MKAFFKRRLAVHIWFLAALLPYGLYLQGISSREAANAVSGITQALKDGYAWFWYLVPFSVVEWFYVAFAVGVLAVLAVLLRRLRSWRGRRLEGAYGCVMVLACMFQIGRAHV